MEFNAYITNISGSWVLYYFLCFSIHDSWINHTHILNSFKCIFHFTCTFSALSLFFCHFFDQFLFHYRHDICALLFFVFGYFFYQFLFYFIITIFSHCLFSFLVYFLISFYFIIITIGRMHCHSFLNLIPVRFYRIIISCFTLTLLYLIFLFSLLSFSSIMFFSPFLGVDVIDSLFSFSLLAICLLFFRKFNSLCRVSPFSFSALSMSLKVDMKLLAEIMREQ